MPEVDSTEQADRRITLSYAFALLLLASIAITAHWAQSEVIEQQYRSAEVVNVAGRQRMLSQRIAWSIVALPEYDAAVASAAARRLELASAELLQGHERLVRGTLAWQPTDPMAGALAQLYREGQQPLDQRVRRFAGALQSFVAASPGAERALQRVAIEWEAQGPLLEALEQAVLLYQRNGELQVARLERVATSLLATLLIVLLLEVLFIFRPLVRYIQRQRAQLLTLAQTDPLTGCSNRRVFFEIGRKLLFADQRRQAPSTLLALDIDHFKEVNDGFGHAAGDAAICHVARILLASLRKSDVLGRIGGEEFAVLLPHTAQASGVIVAEKVRRAIEASELQFEACRIAMTVSIGVAQVEDGAEDLGEALNAADHAMYRAKRAGRNRVCVVACVGRDETAHRVSSEPVPIGLPAVSAGG